MARLVIFDVDGTLVDSQAFILAAMRGAFGEAGLEVPPRADVLGIVGLSLPQAMAALRPDLAPETQAQLVTGYKSAYQTLRASGAPEAETRFFPGALDALERLAEAEHVLGIATGKARRGLDHLLDGHDLRARFTVTQSSDDAPSKPHPGMVLNCLEATGIAPSEAVVIGDTAFDMEMARSAGARALGVAWGYHTEDRLQAGGAERLIKSFDALDGALAELWETA
ncbi:MAG: HAD-IA family hydrolase [Pseudomonadota bacterium]